MKPDASSPGNPARLSLDDYAPSEVAHRVDALGVSKASLPALQTLVLAILAGAFIAFGAMLFTVVITGSPFGYGPTRWLGGIAFSLGLILVVVAGAELFTGNNLITMAWASRRISTSQLMRNWGLVYIGNFAGAVATAAMVAMSGVFGDAGNDVYQTALAIARAKVEIDFVTAFFRGLLCNVLVCLSVWLCLAAHSVSGKILAIVFPISAFVALGFEHSIANMYFIPVAAFLGDTTITGGALVANLVPVTLGNMVGGSVLVALVYWVCYLRP